DPASDAGRESVEWSAGGFLCLFALLAAVITPAVVICSGQYEHILKMRYLLVSWFQPIVAAVTLYGIAVVGKPMVKTTVNLLTTGLVLLWSFALSPVPGWGAVEKLSDYIPPLVKCLDEHKERYDLQWGMSSYWNARLISLFSTKGIRANQVMPDGSVFLWINNANAYLGEKGAGITAPSYTFTVMSRLDPDALRPIVGPPRAVFSCGGEEVRVFGPDASRSLKEMWRRQLVGSGGSADGTR
ncbi:MAG: hypothetical protein V2B18_14945, partial [Pseudomonadota bacterium]